MSTTTFYRTIFTAADEAAVLSHIRADFKALRGTWRTHASPQQRRNLRRQIRLAITRVRTYRRAKKAIRYAAAVVEPAPSVTYRNPWLTCSGCGCRVGTSGVCDFCK